jgi:hypothetical protein
MNDLMHVLPSMLHNGLENYIVPGLRSFLVGDGTAAKGKVRLFTASREATDFITPHSHRFDLTILVLAGKVENSIYRRARVDQLRESDHWATSTITQVCGTDGLNKYEHTRDIAPERWVKSTRAYGPGETIYMPYDLIHSIVYHRDSSALLFEGPELTKVSTMLEPWVNGKLVPTFKTEGWMFEKIDG